MNYGVHSLMYMYYAISAKGFKFPKMIAASITSMQLIQMFVALWVAYSWLKKCDPINPNPGYSAIFVYSTYAVLFANFFLQSYCSKGVKRHSKKTEQNNNVQKID